MLNHPKLLFNELVQVLPEKSSKPIFSFLPSFVLRSSALFLTCIFREYLSTLSLDFGSLSWSVCCHRWLAGTVPCRGCPCEVTRSSGVPVGTRLQTVGDARQPCEGHVRRACCDWPHSSSLCGGLTMQGSSGESLAILEDSFQMSK